MTGKRKYFIGFVVIIGALVYLLLTSFKSSLQYYVTVSELKAAENSYDGKILKVAGKASEVVHEGNNYQFIVSEGGNSIRVGYQGFVPDTFRDGSDVVVTGHLKPDGTFEGTQILAKCASKYEAKIK